MKSNLKRVISTFLATALFMMGNIVFSFIKKAIIGMSRRIKRNTDHMMGILGI